VPRGHPPGRPSWACRHCDMCDEYRDERERQLIALENGERDERAASQIVTFKRWLRHYPWPPREHVAYWSAA
jgi:hypothetical protein